MTTATTATANPAPGFHRMKATLGPTKAEALRQGVLADQAKSMAAAPKPATVKTGKTKAATAC